MPEVKSQYMKRAKSSEKTKPRSSCPTDLVLPLAISEPFAAPLCLAQAADYSVDNLNYIALTRAPVKEVEKT